MFKFQIGQAGVIDWLIDREDKNIGTNLAS